MKICATMIVKDEAHVIGRCLESILPLVDCVCICDTGSTDKTFDAIHKAVSVVPDTGIPSKIQPPREVVVPTVVLFHPWENFGANRTRAFRAAEEQFNLTADDWHLVIDADDALEFKDLDKVRNCLTHLHLYNCWSLEVHHDQTRYRRLHFFRADGTWTYKGPAHEHPHRIEGNAKEGVFHPDTCIYRFIGGGATHLVPQAEKFAGHAELFRETLAANPEDTRSAFYLAQSLKDAGQIPEAIQAYLKRASMGGWDQERYYSLLQAGRLMTSDQWADPLRALSDAHLLDPTRAEAPFEIAKVLLDKQFSPPGDPRGNTLHAYQWAEIAATRPEPNKGHLFVEPDVWMWSRDLAAQLRGRLHAG